AVHRTAPQAPPPPPTPPNPPPPRRSQHRCGYAHRVQRREQDKEQQRPSTGWLLQPSAQLGKRLRPCSEAIACHHCTDDEYNQDRHPDKRGAPKPGVGVCIARLIHSFCKIVS